jgi:DNA polymerase-3 subunit epsilon
VLRATHTGARLVLAPHPEAAQRFDAIWIAGGRVVDWGPGESAAELAPRSARAYAEAPAAASLGGWLPADAVAESRLVGAWIAANRPPALELGARTGEAAHTAFLARAGVATAATSTT